MDKNNIVLLQQWLEEHENCPYPTLEDLEDLTVSTGLTEKQVRVWFTNFRNVGVLSFYFV